MDAKTFIQTVLSQAAATGVKLSLSLTALFIGFKLINFAARKIERSAKKRITDKTITRTLVYLFKIGAKTIVLVGLVGYLGIDTGGITALIASLGVGIGLAVNGALSNLAGGVLILLTRPFRIDDFIEAEGYVGTVEDINITNTRLRTPDNKIVFIPNGALSNDTIVNYSLQSTRRLEIFFAISYATDFKKAETVVQKICVEHPQILKDPPPLVRLGEHAQSSLQITTQVWVKNEDLRAVKYDLLERVKESFDAEGIEIPFPRFDVHIKGA